MLAHAAVHRKLGIVAALWLNFISAFGVHSQRRQCPSAAWALHASDVCKSSATAGDPNRNRMCARTAITTASLGDVIISFLSKEDASNKGRHLQNDRL